MSINTIDPTVLEEEDKRDAFEKVFETLAEIKNIPTLVLARGNQYISDEELTSAEEETKLSEKKISTLREIAIIYNALASVAPHNSADLSRWIQSIVQTIERLIDKINKDLRFCLFEYETSRRNLDHFITLLKKNTTLIDLFILYLEDRGLRDSIITLLEKQRKVIEIDASLEEQNTILSNRIELVVSFLNLSIVLRNLDLLIAQKGSRAFFGITHKDISGLIERFGTNHDQLFIEAKKKVDELFFNYPEQRDDHSTELKERLLPYQAKYADPSKVVIPSSPSAIWNIKLTVHDEYVSASDFGKLLYFFSSALEAVDDVEVELVGLGVGSRWARLKVGIKSFFGQEQVKEVTNEFLKDAKKAKDGFFDKEFGQHTASTKKVEQETDNLKTDQRLKEQGLYTTEQQDLLRELDIEERKLLLEERKASLRKLNAEARITELKAADKELDLIERASEMMLIGIAPFSKFSIEINGVRLLEKYEDDIIVATPEQIEEIAAKGELPAPPELEE